MSLKSNNKDTARAFVATLTKQKASLVFSIGITPDSKVKICMADGTNPDAIIEILKQTVKAMGNRENVN